MGSSRQVTWQQGLAVQVRRSPVCFEEQSSHASSEINGRSGKTPPNSGKPHTWGRRRHLRAEPRPVAPGVDAIAFAMQTQLQDNWCWAATATSVSDFYDCTSGWTQCILANGILPLPGGEDSNSNGTVSACDVPWYLDKALNATSNLLDVRSGVVRLRGLDRPDRFGQPASPCEDRSDWRRWALRGTPRLEEDNDRGRVCGRGRSGHWIEHAPLQSTTEDEARITHLHTRN